jgi:RNA polymerase sigma factor (sigma-70 family)
MIQWLRVLRAAAGSDRDLLNRYARDGDEDAFAALVRRYGAGVWAACVRLARRDAEDAFQAVFLTLARKAASVGGSLPAWLHAVTRRVAANLRRADRRRAAVESAAARPDEAPPAPGLRDGLAALDEELARLPERYRAVLIVCCLDGRSRDEAAAQLGWTEGQVKGCLERARELLRARLARRGVELGGVLLAAAVVRAAPPVPPVALLAAGTGVSPAALSLTNGVIHAMTAQKLKVVAAVLVLAGTAGAVTYRAAPGAAGPPADAPPAAPANPVPTPAGEPPAMNRWEKALRNKNLTPKQRAAYEQIAKLHTAKLGQWAEWGVVQIPSFEPDSKLPTDVLYRMGVDVLPVLAEALDDETPTATVTDLREGSLREKKVWRVNELVALLIVRVADRDFVVGEPGKEVGVREIAAHPKAAPEFRKAVVAWHAAFAAKTPTERKVADVTGPWFRNRFDAVIWLGEHKAKAGRAPVAARVDAFYADPKRSFDSTSRAEMSHCALALGQIGDKAALPQVRRVCADMSYWVETYDNSGSSMLEDLFRAYRGLALSGEKDAALKELVRLGADYAPKFEKSYQKEFADRLKEAKGW